jgi:hypothetical protein
VDDAGGGRHHPKVSEGGLAPLEKLVPFPVALELELTVDLECESAVESVYLDGVVDYQIARNERVHLQRRCGVPGHPHDGGPHGGQVHQCRHAGEVLQHNPAGSESNLLLPHLRSVVARKRFHVSIGDYVAIVVPQHRLEQDLDRVRQRIDIRLSS